MKCCTNASERADLVRLTKTRINELLVEKDEKGLLQAYAGYLKKYQRMLQGQLPDFTKDTQLFMDAISDLDIGALITIYSDLAITEDLEEKLRELLKKAIKGAKDAENLNMRFRHNLSTWLRRLLGESY